MYSIIQSQHAFQVVESHVVRDFHTKESRGFAFVTMATTEDAKRCIKKFDHTVQFDRVIVVERVIFSYWFQNESNQKYSV